MNTKKISIIFFFKSRKLHLHFCRKPIIQMFEIYKLQLKFEYFVEVI